MTIFCNTQKSQQGVQAITQLARVGQNVGYMRGHDRVDRILNGFARFLEFNLDRRDVSIEHFGYRRKRVELSQNVGFRFLLLALQNRIAAGNEGICWRVEDLRSGRFRRY